jgi:hypothetical protein
VTSVGSDRQVDLGVYHLAGGFGEVGSSGQDFGPAATGGDQPDSGNPGYSGADRGLDTRGQRESRSR